MKQTDAACGTFFRGNQTANGGLEPGTVQRDDDLLTSVVSSSQELSEFSFLAPLDPIDQSFQNIFSGSAQGPSPATESLR